MWKNVKALIKALFRLYGLDIKRVDPTENNYSWLTKYNISTVLDIGANIGQFSRMIHRILPSAVILSFEPIEECYQRLIENMADLQNFRAFNYAIGDIDSDMEMHVSDFTPSSSLLTMTDIHVQNFPYTAKEHTKKVKIKRLDTVDREFNFGDNLLIKIDVQGYEDRVIRGGQETVSRASVLIIETSFQCLYVGQSMFDDIYEMLKKMDFMYAGAFEQLRSPLDGSILQADSIFVKEGEKNIESV